MRDLEELGRQLDLLDARVKALEAAAQPPRQKEKVKLRGDHPKEDQE